MNLAMWVRQLGLRKMEKKKKKKKEEKGQSAQIFPMLQHPPDSADGGHRVSIPVLKDGFVSAVPDHPPGCSQKGEEVISHSDPPSPWPKLPHLGNNCPESLGTRTHLHRLEDETRVYASQKQVIGCLRLIATEHTKLIARPPLLPQVIRR